MLAAKMSTQSPRRVCAGCSQQIKGKIRLQRCENCYRSRRRKVSPAERARRPVWTHPGQRALASVDRQPNGCWLYTGPLDRDGYGKSLRVGNHPRVLPHRAVYQLLVGPIPVGMHLDHLCHEVETCAGGVGCQHRRCVNPEHLRPASPKANNERSNSISALNALKTHCIHGHEFTPENTQIQTRADGRTWRKCKECHRASLRRRS